MKIGIDISQIVFQGTGVAAYTKSLVEGFSRVGKDNEYILFGSSLRNKKVLKEFSKNFDKKIFKRKYFYLPPKFLEILWNGIHLFPIENLIGEVDVFHSSDWLEPPTKIAKRVTTIHDFAVYKYPETFSQRNGHDIVANQKRKLFFVKHCSDLIIAVSETTKKDAIEILKIPEKKIKVIYEAADPIYYPRNEDLINKVKDKYKISDRYFLFVGTREPRKNLDKAVMAFSQLGNQSSGVSFVFAGKYGWGNDISKLNEKVKLLGRVESEDLACLYSGAEAFIYPSLYEGFGLPILEAMSCGCPVVTSNTGSMKEISGNASILTDPESVESIMEAMEKLLKSNTLKNDLKVRGIKRAGEFSWDKAALQTLEAYRSLLD